ncbi:MAG: radical SAM protein, partial [Pyrinomonadaceae bacterium]
VVAFCEALLESGEKFRWNCSARTDCITEDLIALMAKAGCRGIFFGIETGSERMQQVIYKKLDLAEAEQMIKCTSKHKIITAVSLIYGFPDENMSDVADTVAFFIDSLRYDYSAPQLHILAPLAETPIHSTYRDQMVFDDIFSDMSHQGWRQDPADREMINSYPDIFPNFYAVPTPLLDRQYLKELRDFVLKGMRWCRWLLVALHQDSGDMVKVFDEWRSWRIEKQANQPLDSVELSIYYGKEEFNNNFLEFVRTSYLGQMAQAPLVVSALLDYEKALGKSDMDNDSESQAPDSESAEAAVSISPDVIPRLADGVRVAQLNVDYKKVIKCLKRKGRLKRITAKPAILATRKAAQERTDVLQLTPLSAQLLSLCDGSRSVSEITDLFSAGAADVDSVPPAKVCLFGLEMLRLQKLIVASTQPVAS